MVSGLWIPASDLEATGRGGLVLPHRRWRITEEGHLPEWPGGWQGGAHRNGPLMLAWAAWVWKMQRSVLW
jgi:hypothetical protein